MPRLPPVDSALSAKQVERDLDGDDGDGEESERERLHQLRGHVAKLRQVDPRRRRPFTKAKDRRRSEGASRGEARAAALLPSAGAVREGDVLHVRADGFLKRALVQEAEQRARHADDGCVAQQRPAVPRVLHRRPPNKQSELPAPRRSTPAVVVPQPPVQRRHLGGGARRPPARALHGAKLGGCGGRPGGRVCARRPPRLGEVKAARRAVGCLLVRRCVLRRADGARDRVEQQVGHVLA
mmetsp:Transcript_31086/g.103908  ORF Transcript_31086/g.103908 Transcript_31086/m.103908 type:complete len:239 (-) Transcript_31086:1696-2412(-)